ncbi:hypothetical protein TeGR_g5618 [Tetraparma gracilis]|uniref:Uncharacterized protein n=1 Tax=Tetraparma gracilis TaxID=2962635 RepID=A0ABQ6MFX3_9STRA|nr:hypothetical protein TeGR_g5618 [Tetraparma gracilis]
MPLAHSFLHRSLSASLPKHDEYAAALLAERRGDGGLFLLYGLLECARPGGGRSGKVFRELAKTSPGDEGVLEWAALAAYARGDKKIVGKARDGMKGVTRRTGVGAVLGVMARERAVGDCVREAMDGGAGKAAAVILGVEIGRAKGFETEAVYGLAKLAAELEGGAGMLTDAWMQELWRRGEYARGMKKSDKKLRRKMRAFKYRGVAVK